MFNSRHLQYFIKLLLATTFFVPLIVVPSSFIFPFIVPKILWFRSLTLLALGAYLVLLATDWQKYRPKFSYINTAVCLFLISFGISTFVGVDWYKSFWDNHERMLGFFTIFHFSLYYFIATSVIKNEKEWKWLLRIFLFAGSLVMFVGMWQRFIDPKALLNSGGARVSSTLGNPIYYSGYGLFLFAIGCFLAIREKKFSYWQWYSVIGALLGLGGIFWGDTRGAILGLVAGLGVLLVCYAIALKKYPKTRLILISSIIFLFLFSYFLFLFRHTQFVTNLPAVGRTVNTSLTDVQNSPRWQAWKIAVEAWQERPVFGWGPNNYFYAFNKFYPSKMLEYGWGETWFDNAHNVVMNTLAVQGTVGIILYFSLFGTAIFSLWRGLRQGKIDMHVVCIGTAFLVAHLVSIITVFENPTSYLYFFFFLAFINSQSLIFNLESSTVKDKGDKSISSGLLITTTIIILILIYSTNINPARANQATLGSIRALANYDATSALDIYNNELSKASTPHIDDIRNDYARGVDQALSEVAQKSGVKTASDLFDSAVDGLNKNRVLHPLDVRVNLQLAQLLIVGSQLKNNPTLVMEAEKILEDSLINSPNRQQIIFMLASLKFQLNKPQEALTLSRQAVVGDPNIQEPWWRLALVYKLTGDKIGARKIAEEAVSRGLIFDAQGQQVIDQILAVTTTPTVVDTTTKKK